MRNLPPHTTCIQGARPGFCRLPQNANVLGGGIIDGAPRTFYRQHPMGQSMPASEQDPRPCRLLWVPIVPLQGGGSASHAHFAGEDSGGPQQRSSSGSRPSAPLTLAGRRVETGLDGSRHAMRGRRLEAETRPGVWDWGSPGSSLPEASLPVTSPALFCRWGW